MYRSCNSFGDIHSCYTEVAGAVAGRNSVVGSFLVTVTLQLALLKRSTVVQ